jgi:hypothetical protein
MRRVLSLAALSMLVLSTTAGAQRSSSMYKPSPEIGVDAGISFDLSSGGGTSIDIPAQRIRMGFFLSPALSIEPTFALHSESSDIGRTTIYDVGVGALYHFSTSRAANQFYLRPFVGIIGVSSKFNGPPASSGSDSQTYFGAGAGIKVPLRDRIASRFEANFAHTDGADAIGLLAGLSFYTR